jgi:hypothetical protein
VGTAALGRPRSAAPRFLLMFIHILTWSKLPHHHAVDPKAYGPELGESSDNLSPQ